MNSHKNNFHHSKKKMLMFKLWKTSKQNQK